MLFLQEKITSRAHLILVVTSVLSWLLLGTEIFHLFLPWFCRLFFLQFKTQEPKIKWLQALSFVLIIGITSLGRILMFSQYLPKRKVNNGFAKKVIAYFVI
jgi:hypothetical protein